MCGIAGVIEPHGVTPERAVLEAMGQAIAHRGPDDASVRLYGRAGLSFRRLSIIDVAGGAQPIDNEDGTIHLILNGEIYNHLELRAELTRRGHHFRTRSDVEVVVHGYEELGDEVVCRLRGMFALALWDERKQRLLLARDRLGQKPLVFQHRGERLAFASELQGLLADPSITRAADLESLHHYLSYQYVPSPRTAFVGVQKLPPAHLLVFEDGQVRTSRYWSLSFRPESRVTEAEAAVELCERLKEAVRMRLMSEVPLGAFLSGGLDSSCVVALMAELGPVQTFSIGFEEEEFDELRHARVVAERFATDHHEFVVRPKAAEVLPRLVRHYGEPYADSSALPTYYLAELTSKHVTVALNGDAGDELLAGYDRYKLLPVLSALSGVPAAANACRWLARAFGPSLPRQLQRFLQAVSSTPELAYARVMSCFLPEQKRRLYSPELAERLETDDSLRLLQVRFEEADARDLLGRTLHVDLMTYLPEDLLAKVDIATMAHGLEGRSPFLDHPLVEHVARLPSSMKLGLRGGKRLLRRAMANRLPPSILGRRKKGFGVPISRWFRGELRELVGDCLLSRRAAQRPYFRAQAVRQLVEEHWSLRFDHGPQLWTLLMIELWCRSFLDRPADDPAR
jgi:asparagine synthase (glutamine-hydrolysing)